MHSSSFAGIVIAGGRRDYWCYYRPPTDSVQRILDTHSLAGVWLSMNKLPSNKRVTNSNVLVLQTTFSQWVSKLEKEKTRVVPNSIVMQAAQYQSPVYLNKQEGSTDSVINRDESVPVVDTEKGSRMLLREPSQLTNRRKLMIGLVIVLVIACSWVGATQTAKSSYTNGFSAPYFVTWFTTSWMILVFPLTAPLYFLTGRAKLNTAGVSHLLRYLYHWSKRRLINARNRHDVL